MPTIDPLEAMLDAVVAELATGLGASANVRKGWPEHTVALDLASKPAVSVSLAGEPTRETCPPHRIDRTVAEDPEDAPTWLYRIGWVRATLQVDLWCEYKASREAVGPLVEASLRNGLPHHADLRIDAANYHDRPITAVIVAGVLNDDADTAAVGEWRRIWRLDAVMDVVAEYTGPEIRELVLRLKTRHAAEEGGPDEITEADLTVPTE